MAADTRQASACHRWLRIEIDWRNDSSYGSNRITLCVILFLLRLVIESECELIELVVVILEIDVYHLLVLTLRSVIDTEYLSIQRISVIRKKYHTIIHSQCTLAIGLEVANCVACIRKYPSRTISQRISAVSPCTNRLGTGIVSTVKG